MTRHVAALTALLAVVSTGPALTQTKPNFTGTWVCVSGAKEMIGQEITLKHDATSISFSHGGPVEHAQTFRLDGKETKQADLAHPDETDITQAAWDGDKIVVTVKTANGAQQKRVLSLQADGSLAVEMTVEVGGKAQTFKGIHKKK
jgi:hypothetical protein